VRRDGTKAIDHAAGTALRYHLERFRLDAENRMVPQDRLAGSASARGFAYLGGPLHPDDRFRVHFRVARGGFLWVIAQGRKAAERPLLLYPLHHHLLGETADWLRVQPHRDYCFPSRESPGFDDLLALEPVEGEAAADRELLAILVTADPVPLVVADEAGGGIAIDCQERTMSRKLPAMLHPQVLTDLAPESWCGTTMRWRVTDDPQ